MKLPVILRIFRDDQLTEVKQFDFDQIVIGNQGEVHLQLADPSVAPIHALIEKRDSGYYVCDLGSATGTYWVANDENKKATNPILDEPLESGDEIKVGPFKISFNVGVPKPKVPPPNRIASAQENNKVIPVPPPIAKETHISEVSKEDDSFATTTQEKENSQTTNDTSNPNSSIDTSAAIDTNLTSNANTASVSLPNEIPSSLTKKSAPQNARQNVDKKINKTNKDFKTEKSFKPEIKSAVVSKASTLKKSSEEKKSKKTFAPASFTNDVNKIIKPGRGQCVEVVVTWKERVLGSYHFGGRTNILVGRSAPAQIQLPATVLKGGFKLGELANGIVVVHLNSDMTADLITDNAVISFSELEQSGRFVRTGSGFTCRLEQDEMLRVGIENDTFHFLIRYKEAPPAMSYLPLIPLSTSEITSVLVSVAVVMLLALWVSINTPPEKVEEPKEEEQMRLAQFVYNKPKVPTPPPEPPPPPPKQVKVNTPPPPPPKPQKVEVTDKTQQAQNKGEKDKPIVTPKKSSGGAAPDVAANQNKNSTKKLTSTVKQGGAVKTSSQNSANANSPKKDVTKIGLFSAFGGGGNRAQLDQAYSGAGEALGAGSQATGTSGFNTDRAGDDVGGKFKDTGAGGKGIATQGISGGFTHGRGSGTEGYGRDGEGIGGRDRVTIQTGGTGEEFVGSIDKEAVRKVVQSKKDAIRRCYEKELNLHPELSGRILMKWVIMEQGRVKWVKVMNSTIGNANVENCLKNELATWQFPEPPKNLEAEVVFPFLLQSK